MRVAVGTVYSKWFNIQQLNLQTEIIATRFEVILKKSFEVI